MTLISDLTNFSSWGRIPSESLEYSFPDDERTSTEIIRDVRADTTNSKLHEYYTTLIGRPQKHKSKKYSRSESEKKLVEYHAKKPI